VDKILGPGQRAVVYVCMYVKPILSMLQRLCDYDFRAQAAVCNINCVYVSNSYIKSAVWSSSADCL